MMVLKIVEVIINSSYFEKIYKNFPILLLIFSVLSFYFVNSDFTAFQQNTHTFIPGLEFLNNSDEIDFYSSSILESPKITIIRIINFLFNDWYFGIYFFKVFLNLSVYISLWYLLVTITIHNLIYENVETNNKIRAILIFFFTLFVFGLFKKFQGPGSSLGPLGYGAIQYLKDFNSMHLSFIMGIYGVIFIFNKNKIVLLISILLISFSTIIHPAMGLNNLIMLFLFYTKKFDYNLSKKIFIYFILGFILPVVILKINYPNDNLLTGRELFDIYVNFRHPHHYLVSDKVFNFQFYNFDQFGNQQLRLNLYFIWIVLFMAMLIFSYKFAKKVFVLNFVILFILVLIPVIQYLFVEKLYIKSFIQLGITRFTTLLSIIFLIQLILNIIHFLILKKKLEKNQNSVVSKNFNFDIIKSLILVLIVSFILTKITYTHPLEDKKFNKYHLITTWVKDNIKDKKEFFMIDPKNVDLMNFIRVFGKQHIFYDYEGFPFSPKYIREYINRKDYHKVFVKNLKGENSIKTNEYYNQLIKYVVIDKNDKIQNNIFGEIIYEDKFYKIIKL